MNLLEAENGKVYRIKEIHGGRGLRVRLRTIGLHIGDLVERISEGFGGPLLIKNISLNTKIAIGKGMAMKIIVEPVEAKWNERR